MYVSSSGSKTDFAWLIAGQFFIFSGILGFVEHFKQYRFNAIIYKK